MKITASLLLSQGSCKSETLRFHEDFPEGLVLNSRTPLEKIVCLLCQYDPGCRILADLFCEKSCFTYGRYCNKCPFWDGRESSEVIIKKAVS